jgi:hypothetical protein
VSDSGGDPPTPQLAANIAVYHVVLRFIRLLSREIYEAMEPCRWRKSKKSFVKSFSKNDPVAKSKKTGAAWRLSAVALRVPFP